MNSSIEVTLVEPNSTYYTCPFSNLVVGGVKGMPAIAHDYKTLQSKYGVNFVRARAYQVKSNAVVLEDGTKVPFDRAVVSPGVDIRYDKMPGHSQSIEKKNAAFLESWTSNNAVETSARSDGQWWNRHYLSSG